MQKVVIIDYGMGNIHSVAKALEHVAPHDRVIIAHHPNEVKSADRVVLPGVGAIRDCIHAIKAAGFDDAVYETVHQAKPLLGVCVGMQALMDHSEENNGVACLGVIPGEVKFFGDPALNFHEKGLKVPHMGWNQVIFNPHPLFHGIESNSRFYFVHSYYVVPKSENQIQASTDYGIRFCSAVAKDNIFAVQFHPEKSQHDGLQVYKNFMAWNE